MRSLEQPKEYTQKADIQDILVKNINKFVMVRGYFFAIKGILKELTKVLSNELALEHRKLSEGFLEKNGSFVVSVKNGRNLANVVVFADSIISIASQDDLPIVIRTKMPGK